MLLNNIAKIRLFSQQIEGTKFKTAKDIVGWMGAMQAQDFNSAKWAVGVRLPHSSDKLIESAIDKGEIIRTHLLRPTWHFASAEDIYWMIELTSPQIRRILKSRDNMRELSESIYKKSNAVLVKALKGDKHLTKDELIAVLAQAKIQTDEFRASHIFLRAEIDGIICSGKIKSNKQTFALLYERIAKVKTLLRDEALAMLADKYFTSHSPATIQDFIWWSGLPVSDARHALEIVKSKFNSEIIGMQTYWYSNSFKNTKLNKESLYLLPAYDEFIISYKDRTASLPSENNKKAVSSNGIFRPIIVLNGQIIGLWRRTIKNDKVSLEADIFKSCNKATKILLEMKFIEYARFIGKEAVGIKYK